MPQAPVSAPKLVPNSPRCPPDPKPRPKTRRGATLLANARKSRPSSAPNARRYADGVVWKLRFSDLGLSGTLSVRDLWHRADVANVESGISVSTFRSGGGGGGVTRREAASTGARLRETSRSPRLRCSAQQDWSRNAAENPDHSAPVNHSWLPRCLRWRRRGTARRVGSVANCDSAPRT